MRTTKLRLKILSTGAPAREVAMALGIYPTRLSEYCCGKKSIPKKDLISMAEWFRCSPVELIGWVEDHDIVPR